MTSRATARRAFVPSVVAASALLLGGCGQLTNPLQTDEPYQSSDGVSVHMGEVQMRGIVLVADAAESPGVLVGNLINDSSEDIEVSLAPEADPDAGPAPVVTVEAPAYSSTSLSTEEQVTVPVGATEPGGVLRLQISTPTSGVNVIDVPVLPAREYYEGFTPTASPSEQPEG